MKTALLLVISLNLIAFSSECQKVNLCGIWYSDENQCPAAVFHHEVYAISDNAPDSVIATKIIGDSCVTTGHLSFFSYQIYDSVTYYVGVWEGTPQLPNYIPIGGELIVIDSSHLLLLITGDSINIYKYSCYEIDSLGLSPSAYGLPCNCSPVADFQSSKITLCANNCINFTDLSTNATSWKWSFTGAIDSTSTSQNPQNICYSTPGTYNVTLIASNSAGSDSVTFSNYITVKPAPTTPLIIQSHDTLYCSNNFTYYQWYYDSTLIPGATDTLLVFGYGGNYNIMVTNADGCFIGAGINITGIDEFLAMGYISLSPNPASNQLTIHTSSFHNEAVTVSIMNVLGKIILEEKLKWSSYISININNLSAGIYFLQIKTENGNVVRKFVKL